MPIFYQNFLAESQDKALKKIRDLKDQIDLDKKAKQDIESYYRNTLDEKEKLIALLKISQVTESQPQSPTKSEKEEPVFNVKTESLEELKDKNKRLELLLVKSKEFVKAQKEQLNALNNEKENTKKVNENEILMKLEEERNRFESKCKTAELKINELNLMIAESRDSQVKLNTELNQKDIFYQDQIKMMKIEFDEKISVLHFTSFTSISFDQNVAYILTSDADTPIQNMAF